MVDYPKLDLCASLKYPENFNIRYLKLPKQNLNTHMIIMITDIYCRNCTVEVFQFLSFDSFPLIQSNSNFIGLLQLLICNGIFQCKFEELDLR